MPPCTFTSEPGTALVDDVGYQEKVRSFGVEENVQLSGEMAFSLGNKSAIWWHLLGNKGDMGLLGRKPT
jgi:hypothetical protein